MRLAIRDPKDFWSGLIFTAAGVAFGLIAQDYEMGSAFRMGPAYFPTLLSGLLALVGLTILLRSFLVGGTSVPRLAVKPLVYIAGASVLFGIFVRELGLVISIFALVLLSASASVYFRWRIAPVLAIALAAFSTLLFVSALGLPIPVIGHWLGG